ncbi:caspase domain-containing protein [Mycena haematopus]|nr:caspase domain-containing protein [Mycena haematopus]
MDARTRIPSAVEQTESPHPAKTHLEQIPEHSECAPSLSSSFPFHCAGQRRALLIGIQSSKADGYGVLDGAHEDVYKMRDLLLDIYQYTPSQITILVDDGIEGHVQPTRANILTAIKDFVKDVKEGDKLCFHYSGHSTQIPNRSNSEEDGMDECLIPMDGVQIVDNELHEALVKPLPAGSHLVAVLDTCNSGSLLDLKHYRCNRVPVPWIWRGRRNSEELWNGVGERLLPIPLSCGLAELIPSSVRRNARVMTLSQTTAPALQTYNEPTMPVRAPTRRSVISVVCDPPTSSSPSSRSSTGAGGLARTASGPIANSGIANGSSTIIKSRPLARLRAGSKASLQQLRTFSLSTNKGKDYEKDKENLTTEDVGTVLPALSKLKWFLPDEEAAHCESPVGQWPCNGWCRNVEGRSTAMEEGDEVKADVISLASCKDSQKAWESEDGISMTSSLVDLLREDPHRTLKDVLIRMSHATYSLALMRHSRAKAYKKQRKNYAAHLVHKIRKLERGNRSTASLVPPPAIAARPTFPHAGGPRKMVQVIAEHIASLRRQLSEVRQDKGYDTSSFQNPELASPRPLDMSRPWRM